MTRRRWLRIAALCVIGVIVLWVAGSFLMEQGVEEYYSRGWQSTSTRDAQLREVFVTAPAVMPAAVAVSDAVEAWVTDAWVERLTHIEYRWHLVRRVVVDSGYRLVLHLAKGPVSGQAATLRKRECFASVDFYLDDKPARSSGDCP